MAQRQMQRVAIGDARLLEECERDVGPSVSEVGIDDVDDAREPTVLDCRLGHGQAHDLIHGVCGPHLLVGDDAARQPCGTVAEKVATMENARAARVGIAVDGLVDLTHLGNADVACKVRERTVIWRHHVVAARGSSDASTTRRAHARIDHAHVDGALGPERQALIQAVARTPRVVAGDVMRAVEDLELAVNALHHAVHGAHGSLCVGEIGLEH